MKKTKYKAVVFETRDGLRCRLFKKFLIYWCIDEGYRPCKSSVVFLIDEQLARWKDFYGQDLSIEDCRLK